ncbi:OmpA family protein [Celeribacter arenosi]|uniref:OmpA family protein n=1 Tax=Celeribacter arenosi TaxID=792649 RepID=A0ABP7JZG0_9RHOB
MTRPRPLIALLGTAACAIALASVSPAPLAAFDLPSAAQLTMERSTAERSFSFPVTTYSDEGVTTIDVLGTRNRRAYRLTGTSLTPYQMIAPLAAQLAAAGYTSRLACADVVCGGFDFRYRLALLPEPAMHVDLGNFQYLLATHEDGRAASIVTSRGRTAGFIHLTEVSPKGAPRLIVDTVAPSPTETTTTKVITAPAGSIPAELSQTGHVSLDDLSFAPGSSTLGDGPFASLAELAKYLRDEPQARMVLVGHTDNVGALDANQALSTARARAVRTRLIDAHGVASDRLDAMGVGYLAPRASNATPEGREANRRVEAVLAAPE